MSHNTEVSEETAPVLGLMQNVLIQPTFIEHLLCTKHGLGMGDDGEAAGWDSDAELQVLD